MPLIVRLGDGSDHGGTVVSSASKWKCEGALIARKGDLHSCPIPGHGVTAIVSGSGRWKCEGADVARQGDVAGCGAALISGAAKWQCE
ncbi:PAAR domain-containing protein [Mesorhizobium sp. B2-5-9]|uniref:PAAR domain-containing protein n=1 Tax=Mesorhizobium sp. B2-5-9 TaxID=2589921 RepID=UPI00112E5B80|nr:PAAR domain-containing protein [Mesorhizobium sp. B2-5-9]TPK15170.1 PAAR domain-containing protein [Mesorhizobium sp. B2-5-9]